tara:strand:+ start:1940 stop:2047 length:108 start_codon:yes stop_codon:yes gene_type:complete
MKKIKLYDPVKNNTWIMMFGFEAPKNMNYRRKWTK